MNKRKLFHREIADRLGEIGAVITLVRWPLMSNIATTNPWGNHVILP